MNTKAPPMKGGTLGGFAKLYSSISGHRSGWRTSWLSPRRPDCGDDR